MSPADEGTDASSASPPAPAIASSPELPVDASLARRLASLAYEAMILCALLLLAGFVTLPLAPPVAGNALRFPDAPARALALAVAFGASAVYFVVSWSNGRRTLPMKTWHIALVRRDGGVVDARTAFTRYLSGWIGPVLALVGCAALRPLGATAWGLVLVGLNFLWALAEPERRFLHDRIAGTRLVRR